MRIDCPECDRTIHAENAPLGESTKRCDCGAFVTTERRSTLTTVRAYRRSRGLGWVDASFTDMEG